MFSYLSQQSRNVGSTQRFDKSRTHVIVIHAITTAMSQELCLEDHVTKIYKDHITDMHMGVSYHHSCTSSYGINM